jgi:hypothetical protein
MIVETDVEAFVVLHRAHGRLAGEVRGPAAAGFRFVVACRCGVCFERRLTQDEPLEELVSALARAQRARG